VLLLRSERIGLSEMFFPGDITFRNHAFDSLHFESAYYDTRLKKLVFFFSYLECKNIMKLIAVCTLIFVPK